ncbi:MAG: endonuclease [Gammaproteobacteria bacterium]|jgi:endonuclease-3 related protein
MTLLKVHDMLLAHYGRQHWWPARTCFEVMVGAVLTQNTAWTSVEKAITRLHAAQALDAEVILHSPQRRVAEWIRPAGYFNVKAKRLRNFCAWYLARGGEKKLRRFDTPALRRELLSINGVGPETADDILLYAFHRPVFVIDAYTRRLLSRLRLAPGDVAYDELRVQIEQTLKRATRGRRELVPLFNEYHALIVRHAKDICRPRPRCEICCLSRRCPAATQ